MQNPTDACTQTHYHHLLLLSHLHYLSHTKNNIASILALSLTHTFSVSTICVYHNCSHFLSLRVSYEKYALASPPNTVTVLGRGRESMSLSPFIFPSTWLTHTLVDSPFYSCEKEETYSSCRRRRCCCCCWGKKLESQFNHGDTTILQRYIFQVFLRRTLSRESQGTLNLITIFSGWLSIFQPFSLLHSSLFCVHPSCLSAFPDILSMPLSACCSGIISLKIFLLYLYFCKILMRHLQL